MRGQIKQLLNGLHKATVIVTHDQIEALTIADRIAVMRDGIIEQVASPHDIFAKPANVFVAGFIGTPQMNLIEARLIAADDRHGDRRHGGAGGGAAAPRQRSRCRGAAAERRNASAHRGRAPRAASRLRPKQAPPPSQAGST